MNILARGCVLLLAATAPAVVSAASALVHLEGPGPEAYLKLVGIAPVAGMTYALIAEPYSDTGGQWMKVGGYLDGCHLREIAKDSVVLTERRTGREITLHLSGTGLSAGEDSAKRRKAWINSEENPMYARPFRLPLEVSGGWLNLSQEDKSQVIAVYRDFGWDVVVTESAAGGPHLGWKSIYAVERKAAQAQARVDFENSLNADQQAIYAKIKATFPDTRPGGVGPKSPEQIQADNQVRWSEWRKLRATLSPSQHELAGC